MDVDRKREFDLTRRQNERWIAAFLVLFAAVMGTVELGRALLGGPDYRLPIVPVAFAAVAYYCWAFVQAGRRTPSYAEYVLRTTLEVSVPTALICLAAVTSLELALLNVSVLVWAVAIFLTILRLHRSLPIYAGILAGTQWIVAYYALVTPSLATHPVLKPSTAWERVLLLVFCGLLASRISSSFTRLTSRVTDTSLERERVRRAFGAYVAEPVVERVLSGDLKLETERRAISVLFVDIRDFTHFSEGRDPAAVLTRLNTALEAFSLEVRERGGIVNKYLGDGLLALFGAPDAMPDHPRQAALTALAISRAAQRLRETGVYPELRVGIGLHSGEVVVGDVGGQGHREYTAIGDVVNVTSRVESMTKELGVPVLVTSALLDQVGDGFEVGHSYSVKLRGREEDVVLHELVDGPRELPRPPDNRDRDLPYAK